MKTPMNVMTSLKKKRKNQKGFSLVELIVVLVIMAILAAALIPSLTGYIRQTRQSTAKNEASMCVSAAQTISSSAFADPSGKYNWVYATAKTSTFSTFATGEAITSGDIIEEVKSMSEVPSAASITSITIDATTGVVEGLVYVSANGQTVKYVSGAYTVE